jgi:diguanylate cyclase (GGDEF)-like protein
MRFSLRYKIFIFCLLTGILVLFTTGIYFFVKTMRLEGIADKTSFLSLAESNFVTISKTILELEHLPLEYMEKKSIEIEAKLPEISTKAINEINKCSMCHSEPYFITWNVKPMVNFLRENGENLIESVKLDNKVLQDRYMRLQNVYLSYTEEILKWLSKDVFMHPEHIKKNILSALKIPWKHVIIIFSIAIVFILIISLIFSQWITYPLKIISRQAEKIKAGAISSEIKLDQKDEIGVLAMNMEEMRVALYNAIIEEQKRKNNIAALHEISLALSGTLSISEITERLAERISEMIKIDAMCIYFKVKTHLELKYQRGFPQEKIESLSQLKTWDFPFIEDQWRKGSYVIDGDFPVTVDKYGLPEPYKEFQSHIFIPIRMQSELFGIIQLFNRKSGLFKDVDLTLIDSIGLTAGICMSNVLRHYNVLEQSITDPLTGLYNRRYFFTILERELKRIDRYKNELSLVMIDLNNFKEINDVYGHPAGDTVLVEFSKIFRQLSRDIDILARYGGDEFVALLPNVPLKGAITYAERIRRSTETMEFNNGKFARGYMTISAGVVTALPGKHTTDSLIKEADELLYKSKKKGKNRVTGALKRTDG